MEKHTRESQQRHRQTKQLVAQRKHSRQILMGLLVAVIVAVSAIWPNVVALFLMNVAVGAFDFLKSPWAMGMAIFGLLHNYNKR